MSTTDKIVIEPDQGMVAYTDGGCDQFPRFIGSGVHGYLYQDIRPKKGTGLATHILTKEGYRTKGGEEPLEEVVPTHYLNITSGRVELGTNNIAELLAMNAALDKALEFNIKQLHLVADSKYVLDGLTSWSNSWIKNNWFKIDGTPVPNADIWKPVMTKWNALKGRGVKITTAWVRGHGDGRDDSFGNMIADELATVGKAFSAQQIGRENFSCDKAEGYWKSEVDRHPILCMRSMYFSTVKATQRVGEYLLGNQNADADLVGTRNSDGAYGVVQLHERDPLLEMIREHQSAISGEDERLVRANIGNAFSPNVYKHLDAYGSFAMTRPKPAFPYNLYDLEGKAEVTSVLDPQRISERTFTCLNHLRTLLIAFKENDLSGIVQTDITDLLYDKKTVTKKKVEVTELALKAEMNVGFAALPTKLNVKPDENEIQVPVTLTLGMDLPDRNTLKRLEELNPIVTTLTWLEAPGVFRYATIVRCDGADSIWCGYYSNMVFLAQVLKTV